MGDSERIVRHRVEVKLRRPRITAGNMPFASAKYGWSWPESGGCISRSDTNNGSDIECYQPNAATGFLLQSVLRGHVDANCILVDESSFWRRYPDAVNEVLISTRREMHSPLMNASFFALPVTPEFSNGFSMDQRSIAHQLKVDVSRGRRSTNEIGIHNYNSLVTTFCESFNIPAHIISARSFR